MNNWHKKLWHDPVWSKVIAAAIIALASLAITYFLDWWPAIGQITQSIYVTATSHISLPLWIMVFVSILALLFIIYIFALLWNRFFQNPTPQVTWRSYNVDLFHGVRWRWKYADENGMILLHEVHAFCPICDYQVRPLKSGGFDALDNIVLYCDSCGKVIGHYQENYTSLCNKVIRLVQQKLRTDSWQVSK